MLETEQLRSKIKQEIDHADEKVLRIVNAILEIEQEHDFWTDLPDYVKNEVEESIVEADKGLGKTHQEVMKEYKKYL